MNKNETELITDKNLSELVRKANTGDKQSLAVLRHELTTENAQANVLVWMGTHSNIVVRIIRTIKFKSSIEGLETKYMVRFF